MNIRQAILPDMSFILHVLAEMHDEPEQPLDPVNWIKVSHLLVDLIARGWVLVAVDEEDNRIVGTIGGAVTTEWYSDQPVLSDYWFYVKKDSRKSPAGFKLMKAFKAMAKELDLPLKVGHTLGQDIERMDRFYGKLGFERTGTLYRKAS